MLRMPVAVGRQDPHRERSRKHGDQDSEEHHQSAEKFFVTILRGNIHMAHGAKGEKAEIGSRLSQNSTERNNILFDEYALYVCFTYVFYVLICLVDFLEEMCYTRNKDISCRDKNLSRFSSPMTIPINIYNAETKISSCRDES